MAVIATRGGKEFLQNCIMSYRVKQKLFMYKEEEEYVEG
jgi:hypothetical protein